MIDDEANFGDILDASEVQATVKFRPKQRPKPRKTALSSRSAAPNPTEKTGDGKVGALNQVNSSKELTSQERTSLTCPGSESVDIIAGSQGILDTPLEDALTVPQGPLAGASAADGNSQDGDHNDDPSKLAIHQENFVVSDINMSPNRLGGKVIDDIVEFGDMCDAQVEEGRVPKFQPKAQTKLPKEIAKTQKTNQNLETSTVDVVSRNGKGNNIQTKLHDNQVQGPTVGREKGKSKSVSFALSDASGVATPTGTFSEMGNIGDSCSDKLTDENLSNSSQQMAEKLSVTEDQYSNDQDHDGEPLDHDVQQQPKSDVGERASSMKLRCRKKLEKVGTPNHTVDDYFGEDCVEPSLAEEDNDSGDDYTTGNNRKARKKSRDGVEELQQQKVKKNKSKVSSRGRKRTLKDELAEKPEKKKLTHRIRQRTPKEVTDLLATRHEEIEHMKLSAAHLRLLQEARERVKAKEIPSGPSSNTRNFQREDMDDLDYRDEEARFFDNDTTENHVQNAKKLNYQSYMNKPARGKWSKSDTDMFYEGLRQFGSDFAMIQQLFPDKTRHQVRQKFKSEEKKNPLLVHDAIIHRSGDNLYFKKVIKQLNIEDAVLPETNNTHKQDGASSERGPGTENVLDDFNDEEENSNWSNEEHGGQMADAREEHDPGNDGDDDDLGDVFDWY